MKLMKRANGHYPAPKDLRRSEMTPRHVVPAATAAEIRRAVGITPEDRRVAMEVMRRTGLLEGNGVG